MYVTWLAYVYAKLLIKGSLPTGPNLTLFLSLVQSTSGEVDM